MNKLIVMLTLLLATLLVIPAYAGMDDKSDRLSSEQSGVFSPGYINAAKQKTDAIINQLSKQKDRMDNAVEYVNDKLSSEVDEKSNPEVKPELKHKTGGSSGSSAENKAQTAANKTQNIDNSTTIFTMPTANPEDVPVEIRNAVQGYLNNQEGGSAVDHRIVATGGKYAVIWNEVSNDGNNTCSLKAQMFNANGTALLSNPYTIASDMVYSCDYMSGIKDVKALSDGNVAVFWNEAEAYPGYNGYPYYKSAFKMQIFNNSGTALLPDSYRISSNNSNAEVDNITAFSNGNLAVFWKEYDSGGIRSLKAQMFSGNGATLSSGSYNLANNMNEAFIENVTTLSNGNVAVFWKEQGLGGGYTWSFKAQMFGANGNLSDAYTLADNAGYSKEIENVTALSNGNVAVSWKDLDMSSGWKYSLNVQMLGANGAPLSSDSYNLASDMVRASIQNITALPDGNVAVFWSELGDDFKESLKEQIFTSGGIPLYSGGRTIIDNAVGRYDYTTGFAISNVTMLSDGNVAVFWSEPGEGGGDPFQSHLKGQIFNIDGTPVFSDPYNIADNIKSYSSIYDVTSLANGNVAVFWTTGDNCVPDWSLNVQILGADGSMLFSDPYSLTANGPPPEIYNVTALSNGNLAVFWDGRGDDWNHLLKAQIFGEDGTPLLSDDYNLSNTPAGGNDGTINNVTALSNGDLAVFWNEQGDNYQSSLKSQILDSDGNALTFDSLPNSIVNAAENNLSQSFEISPLLGNYNTPRFTQDSAITLPVLGNDKALSVQNEAGGIFGYLLANKDALRQGGAGEADPGLLAKIVHDSLQSSALAVANGQISPQELDIAMSLANILRNPTGDQKLVLDVTEALLKEINKVEQETGSPELKKASDDLLQAVAAVLIAQAIPDLLKEGDVANVKAMFSELDKTKGSILFEYQDSIRPYYEEIAKELSKNMDILQLKNILSKNITKDELEKLPPNELDKIMQKLRAAKDKSFESEYIIQQEAKYHKQYVEPNKKKLEEKMKKMMQEFTKRISKTLENATPAKK